MREKLVFETDVMLHKFDLRTSSSQRWSHVWNCKHPVWFNDMPEWRWWLSNKESWAPWILIPLSVIILSIDLSLSLSQERNNSISTGQISEGWNDATPNNAYLKWPGGKWQRQLNGASSGVSGREDMAPRWSSSLALCPSAELGCCEQISQLTGVPGHGGMLLHKQEWLCSWMCLNLNSVCSFLISSHRQWKVRQNTKLPFPATYPY